MVDDPSFTIDFFYAPLYELKDHKAVKFITWLDTHYNYVYKDLYIGTYI